MITGLARLGGRPVGILANQSLVKAGVIFPDSSDKAARFIWICNAFNIPLLFLNDIAGFMIGTQVERQGIIRHGAKFLFAISESNVPRICVIVRKAYGGGYLAMSGAPINPDAVLALPTAKPALMGPAAAINAIYYNKIMGSRPKSALPLSRPGRRNTRTRSIPTPWPASSFSRRSSPPPSCGRS